MLCGFEVFLNENNIEADCDFIETVCEQLKERATFVKDMWEEGKYYLSLNHMMKKQSVKNGENKLPICCLSLKIG